MRNALPPGQGASERQAPTDRHSHAPPTPPVRQALLTPPHPKSGQRLLKQGWSELQTASQNAPGPTRRPHALPRRSAPANASVNARNVSRQAAPNRRIKVSTARNRREPDTPTASPHSRDPLPRGDHPRRESLWAGRPGTVGQNFRAPQQVLARLENRDFSTARAHRGRCVQTLPRRASLQRLPSLHPRVRRLMRTCVRDDLANLIPEGARENRPGRAKASRPKGAPVAGRRDRLRSAQPHGLRRQTQRSDAHGVIPDGGRDDEFIRSGSVQKGLQSRSHVVDGTYRRA